MNIINILVYIALAYSAFVTLLLAYIVSQDDHDLNVGDVIAAFFVTAVIAKVAML